jgi:ubiquinone/menaquinone biosynthesis C-methylase UbiE
VTEAAYDSIAEWYDRSIRDRALVFAGDLVAHHLFEIVGGVEGISVCDLACGQGETARLMSERGAKVVAVDISQKLLEIARAYEEAHARGVTYVQDDARLLVTLQDSSFDGVLCNMALMDIPDLNATFRAVRRILRPRGWFAFTITHPCFQRPPGQRYDTQGFWRSGNPDGVRGKVGAHHRTLSTYLNAVTEAGMCVEHLCEPPLPERDVPVVLIAFCRLLPGRAD